VNGVTLERKKTRLKYEVKFDLYYKLHSKKKQKSSKLWTFEVLGF